MRRVKNGVMPPPSPQPSPGPNGRSARALSWRWRAWAVAPPPGTWAQPGCPTAARPAAETSNDLSAVDVDVDVDVVTARPHSAGCASIRPMAESARTGNRFAVLAADRAGPRRTR